MPFSVLKCCVLFWTNFWLSVTSDHLTPISSVFEYQVRLMPNRKYAVAHCVCHYFSCLYIWCFVLDEVLRSSPISNVIEYWILFLPRYNNVYYFIVYNIYIYICICERFTNGKNIRSNHTIVRASTAFISDQRWFNLLLIFFFFSF